MIKYEARSLKAIYRLEEVFAKLSQGMRANEYRHEPNNWFIEHISQVYGTAFKVSPFNSLLGNQFIDRPFHLVLTKRIAKYCTKGHLFSGKHRDKKRMVEPELCKKAECKLKNVGLHL